MASQDNEVALLRRRVNKLNASLDQANSMLDRLNAAQAAGEDGVASIYREVQGLRGDEDHYEKRKDLMCQIFELNMEIKDTIDTELEPAAPIGP